MQIYVGNLSENMTDEELRALFTPFGEVKAATIVMDKKTGASERYGFVEMPVKSEGREAVEALRGKEIGGAPMRVKALKPGDAFHDHAMNLHGSKGLKPGGANFRGSAGFRTTGAIRRGGQRGS